MNSSGLDAVQNQQSETIQLLMQQLAMVENQNCQLREQLDRIKREAQQEALKISEGQMRDLQGKKEEAEEGMGKTMPSMMVCHSVTLPL